MAGTRFTKRASASGKKLKIIPPQLATLSTAMPTGPEWVHEIKFDGYRMIAYIQDGTATIVSRSGKDWTGAFQPIADKLAKFKVTSAVLDGELVVMDGKGRTDFTSLKDALSNGEHDRFQYYLFDLLHLNGHDTTALTLLERKELLTEFLRKNTSKAKTQRILLSEHFDNADGNMLQTTCGLGLEGVISKRADAPYQSGRSKIWLKTKCQKRQEFVIGGYTLPTKGLGIGSLLLGYYDGDVFEYAGRVGTGFTAAVAVQLLKSLEKLHQPNKPYESIPTEAKRGAVWVKPKLVAEVEFTEWTPDGHLRHPSFEGLREDKAAKDIVREFAVPLKAIAADTEEETRTPPAKALRKEVAPASSIKPSTAKRKPADVIVGGIKISHPDRLVYPEDGITKQRLAEYYLSVADHILPHLVNRPLSMMRCPEGVGEECFFQRHLSLGQSPHVYEVTVPVKGEEQDFVMIKDIEGLISLAQWGVIELHPWQCTTKNLLKPDRLIFDLDPDPTVPWARVIEGAREVRDRMAQLGLESFVKTTGGKGLHVVIPHTTTYDFATMKAFARLIAESMAQDSPDRYLSKMSKAARKGKIFVDYLRNDTTATAVSAFSARVRPGAPVSMPIAWKELTASLKPLAFTIETVPQRLQKRRADLWADYAGTRQKILVQHLRALNLVP